MFTEIDYQKAYDSSPRVVERDAVHSESTSVHLAYARMPSAEVELGVLCGEWGERCEDRTHIQQRCISGGRPESVRQEQQCS